MSTTTPNVVAERPEFLTVADLVDFLSHKLFFSQQCMLQSTANDTLLSTGIGCGGTFIISGRGILLSWMSDDNYGLLGCDTQAHLEDTTKKDFLDILPPDILIEKKDGDKNYCKIKTMNGKSSEVVFRYLRQVRVNKTQRSGLNLGWYGADQLEDIEQDSWDYLDTRTRRKSQQLRIRFAKANPRGKDWVYQTYIAPAIEASKTDPGAITITRRPSRLGGFIEVEEYRAGDTYAIRAPTEENLALPDGFIEKILRNRTKEYIDRYLHASFEDWGGRIYKEYHESSVHNIHSFPIPDDWPCLVSIDVGGDSPWGIGVHRMDPYWGDVFVTNEFYKESCLTGEIVEWIKSKDSGIPDPREARYIIDPENKVAALELAQKGILCSAARKGPKLPGILLVSDYLHPKPGRKRKIPAQPVDGTLKDIIVEDAPHLWVFKDRCPNWTREHANWPWDRDKATGLPKNKPVDGNDHMCDQEIYALRELPPVENLPMIDPILQELLDRGDYRSYREALKIQEAAGMGAGSNRGVNGEAFLQEVVESDWIGDKSIRQPMEW